MGILIGGVNIELLTVLVLSVICPCAALGAPWLHGHINHIVNSLGMLILEGSIFKEEWEAWVFSSLRYARFF